MIFIEIQNVFSNLFEKIKILKEFNIHNINELTKYELQEEEKEFKDTEDMLYDKEHNLISLFDIQAKNKKLNHKYLYMSDIQVVCNFLKNLEYMSKMNLFFYNLNQKVYECLPYDYYIDAKYISEKECNDLLDKYLIKKKKIFIK